MSVLPGRDILLLLKNRARFSLPQLPTIHDLARLAARHGFRREPAWIGLALLAVLIAYVSLYPLEFAFGVGMRESAWVRNYLARDPRWLDMAANVALFLPLGFLAPTAATRRPIPLAIVLGAAVALAGGLQALQMYIPQRYPSGWDIAGNGAGLALGCAAGWLRARHCERSGAPVIVPRYLVAAAWPIALALPAAAELAGAGTGTGMPDGPAWSAILMSVAGWAGFAALLRMGPGVGLLLPVAVVATIAALAGHSGAGHAADAWALAAGAGLGAPLGILAATRAGGRIALLLLVALALVVARLEPWAWASAVAPFRWLPLAGMLESYPMPGLANAAEKLFGLGVLALLLHRIGWLGAPMIAATGGALLGLEYAQRWLDAGHVAGLTDPLLFVALALWVRSGGRGRGGVEAQRLAGEMRQHEA